MIKNIEKGFKRIAIVLFFLLALLFIVFYPHSITGFFNLCIKGFFHTKYTSINTACGPFFDFLWIFIKYLGFILIFFFVIAFIWKGFKGKFR